MKKITLGALSVAFIMLFFSVVSRADHHSPYPHLKFVDLNIDLDLYEGEMKSARLKRWTYIQNIYVQAEVIGNGVGAVAEVVVNGVARRPRMVIPKKDPNFAISIREVVSSIQFRHISGGNIRIRSVKAYIDPHTISPIGAEIPLMESFEEHPLCHKCGNFGSGLPHSIYPQSNIASRIGYRARKLAIALRDFTTYKTYGLYLLPIVKTGARAYYIAEARGVLSLYTRRALLVLKKQIEFAAPFFEQYFELSNEYVSKLVGGLFRLGHQIDDLLDESASLPGAVKP